VISWRPCGRRPRGYQFRPAYKSHGLCADSNATKAIDFACESFSAIATKCSPRPSYLRMTVRRVSIVDSIGMSLARNARSGGSPMIAVSHNRVTTRWTSTLKSQPSPAAR
jgi:hypothetical protein